MRDTSTGHAVLVSGHREPGTSATWVFMPEDDKASSESLVRSTDYSLYVVTACANDEPSGCLAGFVTQASIDPVRFIVCVSKINHTFGVALTSPGLGLHLLGADQRDTASLFGEQTGDVIDKFAVCSVDARCDRSTNPRRVRSMGRRRGHRSHEWWRS